MTHDVSLPWPRKKSEILRESSSTIKKQTADPAPPVHPNARSAVRLVGHEQKVVPRRVGDLLDAELPDGPVVGGGQLRVRVSQNHQSVRRLRSGINDSLHPVECGPCLGALMCEPLGLRAPLPVRDVGADREDELRFQLDALCWLDEPAAAGCWASASAAAGCCLPAWLAGRARQHAWMPAGCLAWHGMAAAPQRSAAAAGCCCWLPGPPLTVGQSRPQGATSCLLLFDGWVVKPTRTGRPHGHSL
jgi:hypothetical protein